MKRYFLEQLLNVNKNKHSFSYKNYSYQEIEAIIKYTIFFDKSNNSFVVYKLTFDELTTILINSRYKNVNSIKNRNLAKKRIVKYYNNNPFFKSFKNNTILIKSSVIYSNRLIIFKYFKIELNRAIRKNNILQLFFEYKEVLKNINVSLDDSFKYYFTELSFNEYELNNIDPLYFLDLKRKIVLRQFFNFITLLHTFIPSNFSSKYYNFGVFLNKSTLDFSLNFRIPIDPITFKKIEKDLNKLIDIKDNFIKQDIVTSNLSFYKQAIIFNLTYQIKNNRIILNHKIIDLELDGNLLKTKYENLNNYYSTYINSKNTRTYIKNKHNNIVYFLTPEFSQNIYYRFFENEYFINIYQEIYKFNLILHNSDYLLHDNTIYVTKLNVSFKELGAFNNKRELFTFLTNYSVTKNESKLDIYLFLIYIEALEIIEPHNRDVFFNFIKKLKFNKNYDSKTNSSDLFVMFFYNKGIDYEELIYEYVEICKQLNFPINLNLSSQKRIEELHLQLAKKITPASFKVNDVFININTTFELIDTPKKLQEEAIIQHNCVNSFSNAISSGNNAIYTTTLDNKKITINVQLQKIGKKYKMFLKQAKYSYNKVLNKNHRYILKQEIKNINKQLN